MADDQVITVSAELVHLVPDAVRVVEPAAGEKVAPRGATKSAVVPTSPPNGGDVDPPDERPKRRRKPKQT